MDDLALGMAYASRLVVGIILVYAGLAKLRFSGDFARSLRSYAFLPQSVQRAITITLPPAEVALGVAVALALAPVVAGVVGIGLLLTFTAATVLAQGWHGSSDCACFGAITRETVQAATIRNLGLSGLLLAGMAPTLGASGIGSIGVVVVAALLLAVVPPPILRRVSVSDTLGALLAEQNRGRRRFLRLTAVLTTGAGLLALTRGSRVAEAACDSCGSCSSQFIFLNYTTPGCAFYWVRPRQYCNPGCSVCDSWDVQEYCGVPGC